MMSSDTPAAVPIHLATGSAAGLMPVITSSDQARPQSIAPAAPSRPSHLSSKPSDPANDVDLLATAFVWLVEGIVGNNANPRRIAVGYVLEPLGNEPHAVVEHEYARRSGRAPS